MCLPTSSVLFFLPINTLLASLLSISVEIHFFTADGPGPCRWPLVPGGLEARIQCSHCHSRRRSVAGPEILLQAAAGRGNRDHVYGMCISLNKPAFTLLWLALELFPARSQGPTLLGPSRPRDSPETWDVTLLPCPTLSCNDMESFHIVSSQCSPL